MRTWSRRRLARSASWRANARGALREPGHSTTSRTPPRISSSTTTRACAVDWFTTTACHTASVRLGTLVSKGQPLQLVGLRLGDPRLALHVDRLGQQPVKDPRDRKADEHRDVRPIELGRDKPGVLAGGQERKHRREPDEIRRDPTPAPPPVHASGIEDLGDGVMPTSHHVVVDEVDRGPGDEQIQHEQEKSSKLVRKFSPMSKAGMRDSTAVKLMVMMRSVDVGRTFLKESIALIKVSEPPYMFRAVTEMRPSVEKMRAIPPKPVKR